MPAGVAAANPISNSASRCRVLVFASQEDEQIARHGWALLERAEAKASAAPSSRPPRQ